MKRIIITLFLALTLAFAAAPVVFAADLPLVYDEAGLLSDQEKEELNSRAEAISAKYECDVAIVILEKMTDNDDAEQWAIFVYDNYKFGYGAEKSGLLLFLSMEYRDYWLLAHGYGKTAFTAHAMDVMLDGSILPLLGRDDYYKAFSVYLDKAELYLEQARDGRPFDVDTDVEYQAEKAVNTFRAKLAVTIIIPLVISLIICLIWRAQMKTARKASEADNYIPEGGFVLTRYEDRYLYSTQTYTKIEKDDSGGGGGDYSGRGGKF
jgi:uncharacterized membrane protein YgcG